jgi:NAD(P)-dependent dehydrogenase (short-subunit alcohol dehydrogenase family)
MSSFDPFVSATKVAEAFPESIRDKTILITGVSPNSLGLATAAALASQHPDRLILSGRSAEKVQSAVDSLKAAYPLVKYDVLLMDLSSQASVRAAAAQINADANIPTIDILINNAGVMAIPTLTSSEDHIETTFATNHIGHFLFTNLIMPKIIRASEGPGTQTRIINISSYGHQFSPIRFSDINFSKLASELPEQERPEIQKAQYLTGKDLSNDTYSGFFAYGQSKTANILFSVSLNQKLGEKYGIVSYAVHPGAVGTNINRHADPQEIEYALARVKELGFDSSSKTPDQGANSSVLAAVDPSLPPVDTNVIDVTGVYISDCKLDNETCATFARNGILAERLWALSEELVNQRFEF